MAKVYRVDVSLLPVEQVREVKSALDAKSFMVLRRTTSDGRMAAFDAIEEAPYCFPPPDDFKAALGIPEQCTVIDITGLSLLQ